MADATFSSSVPTSTSTSTPTASIGPGGFYIGEASSLDTSSDFDASLGYRPGWAQCLGGYDSCSDACGAPYQQCWHMDANGFGGGNWTGCYAPDMGDVCCQTTSEHYTGASCQRGYYCAEVVTSYYGGVFCCKEVSLR
jgi:hypothetical protein